MSPATPNRPPDPVPATAGSEPDLTAALAELVGRYVGAEPRVVLHAEPLGRLDPAVAAAAYDIAGEAVANAVRHAGAEVCDVSVRLTGDSLVVEVSDDGAGLPQPAVAGGGTRTMQAHALDRGGRLEVLPCAGGGTVVRAVLPLPPAPRG
ncbi:sensor histidine kinase [Nocardioides pantholopis]|uniref:sensor histidine kinase n=1 Tax=Nocardioides pantholopis TaxID=2483798 RepID=UPI000F084C71|nr:ATP-binding protein [Nocardioides pantholopis]